MTNQQLAIQSRNRDETAFQCLFNRHYNSVYAQAFKIMRSHPDADDATSAVFIRLWQKLSKWDPDTDFMAWFRVFRRNTLIDALRKRNRDAKHGILCRKEGLFFLEHTPDPKYDVLEDLIIEEDWQCLEDALCRIPQRSERLAWVLHKIEGYTQKEVAQIMKAKIGTVKIWVHRCKLKLQEELA